MKKLIIFDLDGTLYQFDGADGVDFASSKFYDTIKIKAYDFLSQKLGISLDEAKEVYQKLKKDYNGEVSLGVEDRYQIDRYEWFGATWNLEPERFIEKKDLLQLVKSLDSEIAILTAAPRVWAEKALDYLNLSDYKNNLFTGEPDLRKPDPEIFKMVASKMGFEFQNVISVGDQIQTDILPAKSLGIKTVLVGSDFEEADYCIESLDELLSVLRSLDV